MSTLVRTPSTLHRRQAIATRRSKRFRRDEAKALGSYVQELRRERNYTIRQLGVRSGVTHAHISLIEKGQRLPTPAVIAKLAPPLRVAYEDLLRVAGYLPQRGHEPPPTPDQETLMLLRQVDARTAKIEILLGRLLKNPAGDDGDRLGGRSNVKFFPAPDPR